MELISSVDNVVYKNGFKWTINNFSNVSHRPNFVIRSNLICFEEAKVNWMLEVTPTQCNTIETCIKLKCLIFDQRTDENGRYKFHIKFSNGSLLETNYVSWMNNSSTSRALELNLQTMVTFEDSIVLDVGVVFETISHEIKVTQDPARIKTSYSSLMNLPELTERESSVISLSTFESPDFDASEDEGATVDETEDEKNDEIENVSSEDEVEELEETVEDNYETVDEEADFNDDLEENDDANDEEKFNADEEEDEEKDDEEDDEELVAIEAQKHLVAVVAQKHLGVIKGQQQLEANDEEENLEANDDEEENSEEDFEILNAESMSEEFVDSDDDDDDEEEAPAKFESSYVRLTKRIRKIYLVKMKQIALTSSRYLVTSARVSFDFFYTWNF